MSAAASAYHTMTAPNERILSPSTLCREQDYSVPWQGFLILLLLGLVGLGLIRRNSRK